MKRVSILLFIVLFGCSTEELQEKAKIDVFFDLEGTLDQVVSDLVEQKAKLEKVTVVERKKEQVTLDLDSVQAWRSQLKVFYESDINKLGLENSYVIDSIQAFDGILKVRYTAKKKSDYVKMMECSFRDGKLFLIRINSLDENQVYRIANDYQIYFNHFKKKLALDHFSIKTNKSMILKKDLQIEVDAEVIYP